MKLVDLGLARLMESDESDERITQEGFVIGTPDFLAPEQARNPKGVDIRADIYALGATLYYILTGRVPYTGANATEKLMKHCTEPPPSLLAHRPDVPPQLEQIIHWCMAKQAEGRPQTPLQLALAHPAILPHAHGRRQRSLSRRARDRPTTRTVSRAGVRVSACRSGGGLSRAGGRRLSAGFPDTGNRSEP